MISTQQAAHTMDKTVFPQGTVRQVCVNRHAIMENIQKFTTYPTVIIVENGQMREFHACQCVGLLQFDPTRVDLPATVFVESDVEIIGFRHPYWDQTYLNRPDEPKPSSGWWNIFKVFSFLFTSGVKVAQNTPLLNCLIPESKLKFEEDPESKKATPAITASHESVRDFAKELRNLIEQNKSLDMKRASELRNLIEQNKSLDMKRAANLQGPYDKANLGLQSYMKGGNGTLITPLRELLVALETQFPNLVREDAPRAEQPEKVFLHSNVHAAYITAARIINQPNMPPHKATYDALNGLVVALHMHDPGFQQLPVPKLIPSVPTQDDPSNRDKLMVAYKSAVETLAHASSGASQNLTDVLAEIRPELRLAMKFLISALEKDAPGLILNNLAVQGAYLEATRIIADPKLSDLLRIYLGLKALVDSIPDIPNNKPVAQAAAPTMGKPALPTETPPAVNLAKPGSVPYIPLKRKHHC